VHANTDRAKWGKFRDNLHAKLARFRCEFVTKSRQNSTTWHETNPKITLALLPYLTYTLTTVEERPGGTRSRTRTARKRKTRSMPLKMKTGIWFSRQAPTQEQIDNAEEMGFWLVGIKQGRALGLMRLTDYDQVADTRTALRDLAKATEADAIFGVYPPPIQSSLWGQPTDEPGFIPCFAPWNVTRAEEGKTPTFTHKQWVRVGLLGIQD